MNDTGKEILGNNSDKALVTVVHCSNDIKNIIEGKASSKLSSTGPPQARIKQWDIHTEKVKIAESTSNLDSTNISEAERAYNNDNTENVLAVLENSSNSVMFKDCREKFPELLVFGKNQNTEDEIRNGIDVTEAGDKAEDFNIHKNYGLNNNITTKVVPDN